MLLVPIVLRAFKSLFSENNKMLFPLFFQLFKEQKKKGHLSMFSIWYSHAFSVIFPPACLQPPARLQQVFPSMRSVLSPPTHLQFPLFPNILKFFLLNLDNFGRSEKLLGKKLYQRLFNNFYELLLLVGLFCSVFRT